MMDTPSRSLASAIALASLLLAACRDGSSSGPPAPSAAPVQPMGMSSAATLVATTSPAEVLAKLHHPKEAVLGGGALLVLDTPTDSPDPGDGLDVLSVPIAPVASAGSPKTLFSKQRGAEGLAFAGGRLVWITAPSDDGKEHSKIVSAKMGAAAPAPVVRTIDVDETLAVSDGADVFSLGDVKDSAKAKSTNPDVLRIGSDGKATVVTTTAGALVRTAMAVNATHVFWVQGGAIVRAPKSGGEAAAVVKPPAGKIQRMAADDASVYWTDSGTGDPQWSGRVYRASLADGKVETLSDAASPFAIAIDADTVYWTSTADVGGRVMARKKGGKETYVLAKDQHGPRGLGVDDKYVYWVNTADGNVCRVEKASKPSP
jgi:hypothetical protein